MNTIVIFFGQWSIFIFTHQVAPHKILNTRQGLPPQKRLSKGKSNKALCRENARWWEHIPVRRRTRCKKQTSIVVNTDETLLPEYCRMAGTNSTLRKTVNSTSRQTVSRSKLGWGSLPIGGCRRKSWFLLSRFPTTPRPVYHVMWRVSDHDSFWNFLFVNCPTRPRLACVGKCGREKNCAHVHAHAHAHCTLL